MATPRVITSVVVTMLVLGVSAAAWMLRPHTTAGPCEVTAGPLALPEVPETSGLAVGRRTRDVLWTHNDSGNDDVLFGLDATTGDVRARVRVPMTMRDWEDVSAGRCPAVEGTPRRGVRSECLYLSDIGDNGRQRPRIFVLRVPEPRPGDTTTPAPEVIAATYADGPHNAEAMFVVGDDMFVVTKDQVGAVYRATPVVGDSAAVTLQRIGALGLTMVTDAETSVDERTVVVRTLDEVAFYQTAAIVAGGLPVPWLRVDLSGLKERQGEGVALDGSVLHLSSEGKPWSRDGRLLRLRCHLPTI
jgi:hypothetical protein